MAYANWEDGMKLMEEMYTYVLKETFGTLKFSIGEHEVDMSKKWEVWDYAETIKKHYNIDVYEASLDEIKATLKKANLEVEETENRARGIDKLWKAVRKTVVGPVWLVNTPKFISPLSKSNPDDDRATERFQAVIGGSELGNGYSELNDPIDQLERFKEQQAQLDDGTDDEAHPMDEDFVNALEVGLPPTGGLGIGIDRVIMLITNAPSIRDIILFPTMKPL